MEQWGNRVKRRASEPVFGVNHHGMVIVANAWGVDSQPVKRTIQSKMSRQLALFRARCEQEKLQ